MRSPAVLFVCAVLTGCASATPGSGARSPAALTAACPPIDPQIEVLLARTELHDGSERFYARKELARLAQDRDDLVRHLVARHRQMRACMPPGPLRDRALAESRETMTTLLQGRQPGNGGRPIEMTDVSRPPHVFPFFTRMCIQAHGLEDQAACLFLYSPFLLAFDVVTLPIGSWFWAAPDRTEPLLLRDAFPPPQALVEEVDRATE